MEGIRHVFAKPTLEFFGLYFGGIKIKVERKGIGRAPNFGGANELTAFVEVDNFGEMPYLGLGKPAHQCRTVLAVRRTR
jgi:hypothetical protein